MNKAIPLAIFSAVILSACTLSSPTENQQGASPAITTEPTAKGNLAEQVVEPTPYPEPAFRAGLDMQADTTGLNIDEEATILVYANGLEQPITTLSATLETSEHLKIVSVEVNKEAFPMEFKKSVSADGRSTSFAVSNGKGVEGRDITVATIMVKGIAEGPGTITFNSNDTTLLLNDNTEVAPKPEDLPKIEIKVVK